MRTRTVLAVVVVLLGVATLQLSCVGGERRELTQAPASSLFTEALEPELPVISEVDTGEPSASPALTR